VFYFNILERHSRDKRSISLDRFITFKLRWKLIAMSMTTDLEAYLSNAPLPCTQTLDKGVDVLLRRAHLFTTPTENLRTKKFCKIGCWLWRSVSHGWTRWTGLQDRFGTGFMVAQRRHDIQYMYINEKNTIAYYVQ